MSTKLAQLRRRLVRLRRRRRVGRLTIAYSALVTTIGLLLAAVFLADWTMRMGRPERIVLLVIAAGALVWAYRRFTAPWLGKSEDDLDMALLVERQQHIDTDLIAALEFESPEAARWGSVQLEQAVIERTAQTATRIEPKAEVPATPLKRRVGLMAATLVGLAALAALFPDYTTVFLNRLALGSRHYPTGTTIESARINDRELDLNWGTEEVNCPYGQPVRFELRCTGALPAAGYVELKNERGLAASVPLDPTAEGSGVYRGKLERLVDSAVCLFHIGDAWTEPVRIVLLPPPTVNVETEVTPPGYAGSAPEVLKDQRQVSVIEGSRVVLRIVSDKPLKEALLTLDGAPHPMKREGQKSRADEKDTWAVPREVYEAKAEDQKERFPLAAVTEPVRYTIQVTDVHDLQLERPIEGVVRIKVDHPPQVLASILTHYVLPTARPSVAFTATDDYGLARITILPEIIHADGSEEEKPEVVVYDYEKAAQDAKAGPPKQIQQRHRFALAGLGAVKGDQVKVTVRAIDYRGDPERGKSSLSEPLVFQVTDERGIRDAILEQDRESARQLNTMIENQIDVGEAK